MRERAVVEVDVAEPRLRHLDVLRTEQAVLLPRVREVVRAQLARGPGADLRDDLRVSQLVIGGDDLDVLLDLLRARVVDDEVRGLSPTAELGLDVLAIDRVAELAAQVVQVEAAGDAERGGEPGEGSAAAGSHVRG